MLTSREIDAIRFYQGDIRKRAENGQILENEKMEGFYGIPSAYRTMNCLMFEGIENEEERIKEGNGKIVADLFLEIEKVIEVYCDIYRAMCKTVIGLDDTKKQLVYRTERGISMGELKKGYTVSFTSTSKVNKPEEFLCKKVDLTLLDIVFPLNVPHLDFQEILGKDYLFEQQEEVLLPPFLEIELEELELTKEEKQYRDANGCLPHAKYLVLIKGIQNRNFEAESKERKALTLERNQKSVEILKKLISKEKLTEAEKEEYCLWKKDVRSIIWNKFQVIRQQYLKEVEPERKEMLIADVKKMREDFNKKRKKYKSRISIYNIALIVMNTIPLSCMALSFVESIQIIMKIMAVITSMISIFLSQMLKVEVYDIKLMQRSKTYLNLCDLYREIKYECIWNREKEEEYIKRFKDIMKEDSIMSLQNLEIQSQNVEKLYQNDNGMDKK